jgi:hypothetical protein
MIRQAGVLSLFVLLVGCGGGGKAPHADGSPPDPPDANPPDAPAEAAPFDPEVVIPKITKVVDAETRAALTAFGPDGILRFARSTPVLDALLPGDVMVSEPAPAAPNGFLRRVLAVDRSGGLVVVSTVQSTLSEAIDKGELRASRELRPEMLAGNGAVWPMAPAGPPPRKLDRPLLLPGTRISAADGDYPFYVKIDASLGDNLKAQGFIGFGLSFDFQVKIGGKWSPPFIEIEHVRAGLGVRQKGSLALVAGGGVKVGTQVTVAIFPFTPIVFAIGPVPVVITPLLKINVGAKGEIMASLTYSVAEELPISAGLDYNPDDGWRAYSSGTPTYESNSVAAKVSAAVEAYAGARGELLLYGLAGGFTEINGFVKLDAQVPRSPIWRLTGGADAFVGISMDLIIAKYEEKQSLARLTVPIAEAPNGPPTVAITMPATGATVDSTALGGIRLVAEVSDLEDGPSCCAVAWTDDLGEAIPPGKDVMASLSIPGAHTLRATATDAQGASSSATVAITVTKAPPSATITKPMPMQAGLAVGVPAAVEGQGKDGAGMIACDRLSWTSSVPADVFSASARGCVLTVTFASEGPRRLTLTATDAFGTTGATGVDVTVGPRPITAVVSAFIDAPASGVELRTDADFTLRGHATDTDNRVFRDFIWRAAGCGIDQVIGTTAGGTTGAPPLAFTVKNSTLVWKPMSSGFSTCDAVQLTLKATTADGAGVGVSAPTTVRTFKLQ